MKGDSMDKRRFFIIISVAATLLFISLACSTQDLPNLVKKQAGFAVQTGEAVAKTQAVHMVETAFQQAGTQAPEAMSTLQAQAATQLPILMKTLQIQAGTQGVNLVGTLLAQMKTSEVNLFTSSGPFRSPAKGFLGLKYHQDIGDGLGLHPGLDIWSNQQVGKIWTDTGNQRGNPVYAAADGRLGATGGGVEICHPKLDKKQWPDLPDTLVCTYYGHLKDLPEPLAQLEKDQCPNQMLDVKQGDLLGYMNYDTTENSKSVHLHFAVVKQTADGCWTDELADGNTMDPMPYLGLDAKNYDWLSAFP
jgi:murein DD-endopeptidase MepM/ murein hydrolase activator NlpD